MNNTEKNNNHQQQGKTTPQELKTKESERKTSSSSPTEGKTPPSKDTPPGEDKTPPSPKKTPPAKKTVEAPAEKFKVTSSPHLFGKDTVSRIMWTVSLCLAPAGISSIYLFGLKALLVMLFSIAGAVGAEFLWQRLTKQKCTLKDGSAFLTGLLLAYNLPPSVPLWIPVIGGFFAIIICKQLFGGLGQNIFNPALAARGFLLASWPVDMTTWSKPVLNFLAWDTVTTASPLAILKEGKFQDFNNLFPTMENMIKDLLLGNRAGCLGETSALLLIIGGIVLIALKYIDWQVPLTYIGTVGILTWIFGGPQGFFTGNPLFHILAGGLILGAFYMATDYVTIPATIPGRMVFALGCGILTTIIRLKGGYPEGVCYSILIMNSFTPLIDSKIKPTIYGFVKKENKKA